ncbi:MAG TPA: sugar phosphate nucleotidyltransferase [Aestuariivirga sp.]|nr:sugar phosphate nucleotidyltransferase [Aestuariivirga sp.]
MSVVIPVILCGGSGTRLWPLSRTDRPKQLISLTGDSTLLEDTLKRAGTIAGAGEPICVTAAAYGAEVRQSLERLEMKGRLILEPEGRNTAPALAAAALVAHSIDSEGIVVALPADHVIEAGDAFADSVARARAAAEQGWLTIMGVRPRAASSALGYILPGAAIDGLPQVTRVNHFIEKPERSMAERLLATGALWNVGIVVARADAVIEAMRKHEPAVLEAVERSIAKRQVDVEDVCLGHAEFTAAPRISFDKAVLERHEAVAVTAFDATWRDVGTWTEVAELYTADPAGNRQRGRVILSSSQGSFVVSPHRLTVGIGLTDLIIVDTPDALLIANQYQIGRVREVVEGMTDARYPEVAASEGQINTRCISMGAGETIRGELGQDTARYWIVLRGRVSATIEGETSTHVTNESFHISSGQVYRITNTESSAIDLIEVLVEKGH